MATHVEAQARSEGAPRGSAGEGATDPQQRLQPNKRAAPLEPREAADKPAGSSRDDGRPPQPNARPNKHFVPSPGMVAGKIPQHHAVANTPGGQPSDDAAPSGAPPHYYPWHPTWGQGYLPTGSTTPIPCHPRGGGRYVTPGTHPEADPELRRPGLCFDEVVDHRPNGINTIHDAYYAILSYLQDLQDPNNYQEQPLNYHGWTYAHQVASDLGIATTTVLATVYFYHDRFGCRLLDWNHPASDPANQCYAWELAAKYHPGTTAGRRGVHTEDMFQAAGDQSSLSSDSRARCLLFSNGGDIQVHPGPLPPHHPGRAPHPIIMLPSAKYPYPPVRSTTTPATPANEPEAEPRGTNDDQDAAPDTDL